MKFASTPRGHSPRGQDVKQKDLTPGSGAVWKDEKGFAKGFAFFSSTSSKNGQEHRRAMHSSGAADEVVSPCFGPMSITGVDESVDRYIVLHGPGPYRPLLFGSCPTLCSSCTLFRSRIQRIFKDVASGWTLDSGRMECTRKTKWTKKTSLAVLGANLLWTSGPELTDHASLLILFEHAVHVVGAASSFQ